MTRKKLMTPARQQLQLWLPDRMPLAGLPQPARAELLEVIAQLLLETEIEERPTRKPTNE